MPPKTPRPRSWEELFPTAPKPAPLVLPEALEAWAVSPPERHRPDWRLERADAVLSVRPDSSGRVSVDAVGRTVALAADGTLRPQETLVGIVPEALCPASLPGEAPAALALRAVGQAVGGEARALMGALQAAAVAWAAFRGDGVALASDEEGRLAVVHGLPVIDHVLRQITPEADLARRIRLLRRIPADRHDLLPPWRIHVRAKTPATAHDRIDASPRAQEMAASFPNLADLLPH